MKNLSCIIVATLIFTSCKKELNQNGKVESTNKSGETEGFGGNTPAFFKVL